MLHFASILCLLKPLVHYAAVREVTKQFWDKFIFLHLFYLIKWKDKKQKKIGVFASLSFPYWGLQCPDISILGKHGKTRTCISLNYPLMLMSVKEIISSWFTSLCSKKGSNWLWNTWMVILHFLWFCLIPLMVANVQWRSYHPTSIGR